MRIFDHRNVELACEVEGALRGLTRIRAHPLLDPTMRLSPDRLIPSIAVARRGAVTTARGIRCFGLGRFLRPLPRKRLPVSVSSPGYSRSERRIAPEPLARWLGCLLAGILYVVPSAAAVAQDLDSVETAPGEGPLSPARRIVHLSAKLAAGDSRPVRSGLQWRVFEESAGLEGKHRVVVQSSEATPALTLPDGTFVVHAGFGLASAMKRIIVAGKGVTERLVLNAGALRLASLLGDSPIPATHVKIAVFVPEPGNSEAKLVVANAKAGDTIGLPEGAYHVVSTLLDASTFGTTSSTNSVVTAELRVQAGKLTDATLRHRAATMTLKLVSGPGGEAMANTAFTILTPGGDVIREMIGAFPSLVLAEGEYVAIARHDGKTYQANFAVVAGADRDVEIHMQGAVPAPARPDPQHGASEVDR
jgi:hypothetical protein